MLWWCGVVVFVCLLASAVISGASFLWTWAGRIKKRNCVWRGSGHLKLMLNSLRSWHHARHRLAAPVAKNTIARIGPVEVDVPTFKSISWAWGARIQTRLQRDYEWFCDKKGTWRISHLGDLYPPDIFGCLWKPHVAELLQEVQKSAGKPEKGTLQWHEPLEISSFCTVSQRCCKQRLNAEVEWREMEWKEGPQEKGQVWLACCERSRLCAVQLCSGTGRFHGIFILPLKWTNTFCFNFFCLNHVTSVDSAAGSCPQPELQPIPGSDKTDGISDGRIERHQKGYDHTICIATSILCTTEEWYK